VKSERGGKMYDIRMIIDKFNNEHNIKDVIETVTGVIIKGKSLCCPIHGGDNKNGASINVGKNIFSCWTENCGKALSPWNFIQSYYKLDRFKEVAEKVNSLFNTNIPIFEKGAKNKPKNVIENNYACIYTVNKYLNECNSQLEEVLKIDRHILLNAITGLGKTFGIIEMFKKSKDDYIFFLVPTRALAEQVAADYDYSLFYGNMTELPKNKYIVATYNKVMAIQRLLDRDNEFRSLMNEKPLSYTIIVDEVHELMSKRVLLGSISKELEELTINADTSVLMSANTEDVYKAYKDTRMFNNYIAVNSVSNIYNLDNTYIYRVPSNQKVKKALILNKIIENLISHDKVLLQEDNINNLEEYSCLLTENGINNIIINSKNKEEEEVAVEYQSIINNSTLKNIVVLCTSVINAGVNIDNENTCIMMIQDKMQFDTNKIIQFMGRLRSDKGNTGIIFFTQGEKPQYRDNIKSHVNYYTKLAELKAFALNEHYFNKYGLDVTYDELIKDWKSYKNNDDYKYISECLYIKNKLFHVDHVQIYEKSRLKHCSNNYYDNEFIIEMLKGIKTKKIKIIELAPVAAIEEVKSIKEPIKLKDVINNLDSEGEKELELYIKASTKPKDFKNESVKNLYETFKDDKKFKEMISNAKTIVSRIKTIDSSNPHKVFNDILNIYSTFDKPKECRDAINNIKRIEIYNKQFQLNENTKIIGDYMYYIVRKSCDCFVDSTHSISTNKSVYKDMLNDYIKLYECKYEKGVLMDKHNKKINTTKLKQQFNNNITKIYVCTEKMYLKNLR